MGPKPPLFIGFLDYFVLDVHNETQEERWDMQKPGMWRSVIVNNDMKLRLLTDRFSTLDIIY